MAGGGSSARSRGAAGGGRRGVPVVGAAVAVDAAVVGWWCDWYGLERIGSGISLIYLFSFLRVRVPVVAFAILNFSLLASRD